MKKMFLIFILLSVSAFAAPKKYSGDLESYHCDNDGCYVSFSGGNTSVYGGGYIFIDDSFDLSTLNKKDKNDWIHGMCHEHGNRPWRDCTLY